MILLTSFRYKGGVQFPSQNFVDKVGTLSQCTNPVVSLAVLFLFSIVLLLTNLSPCAWESNSQPEKDHLVPAPILPLQNLLYE